MTKRGRALLALGLLTYVVARAFGSKPLYPVALGVLFALLAAWLWVRLARGPMRLHREVGADERYEGDDVEVELRLEHAAQVPPASLVVVEHVAGLGERRTPLESKHGRYTLERLRRGRYAFLEVRAVVEDAFGLQRLEVPLVAPSTLLVYPRLVELDRLFSEGGTFSQDGRRLLLRRPSGFDLHSVREYEQGESLRKVHWRSTAKRGELMVKELEDAPRDEVAILLDCNQGKAAVGGDSFDLQVRAAGSLLLAQARRGRRALLVLNAAQPTTQRVHSFETDWRQAYDLLAAAEPDGRTPVAALLSEDAGSLARALELTVVTAALAPQLVDRLLQRTLNQRRAALVYVDGSSFDGAPAVSEPALLRLSAAGVPVAVLRRGDDLAAKLAGGIRPKAAVG